MNATIHFFSPNSRVPKQIDFLQFNSKEHENTWSQFYFSLVEK